MLNAMQIQAKFRLARKMWEKSAQEWEDWNNGVKKMKDSKEAGYAKRGEHLFIEACGACGAKEVEIDYPGLYPSFTIDGYSYYSVESVASAFDVEV